MTKPYRSNLELTFTILECIRNERVTRISTLTRTVNMGQPQMDPRLDHLEQNGLIHKRLEGKSRIYALTSLGIDTVRIIEEFRHKIQCVGLDL